MGETGPTLEFPSLQNIIDLNRRIIHETGGNLDGAGRLRNEDSLRWVLEIIRYPPFSGGPYQTISEKAAVLAWTIIRSHVFIDGNKRTGFTPSPPHLTTRLQFWAHPRSQNRPGN